MHIYYLHTVRYMRCRLIERNLGLYSDPSETYQAPMVYTSFAADTLPAYRQCLARQQHARLTFWYSSPAATSSSPPLRSTGVGLIP